MADFKTEVALGNIPNYITDNKFGKVEDKENADTPFDIWAFADDGLTPSQAQKVFPSTAATLYVCSSNASDTDVDVKVTYIDSAGVEQEAVINLNGQAPVSVGETGLDINRLKIENDTAPLGKVYGAISNNFTAGVPDTPSDVLAFVQVGFNQSQLSHYTVPLGYTMIIERMYISISRASGSNGSAKIKLNITEYQKVEITKRRYFPTTAVAIDKDELIIVPERAHVRPECDYVSDTDTSFTCIWSYTLIKN